MSPSEVPGNRRSPRSVLKMRTSMSGFLKTEFSFGKGIGGGSLARATMKAIQRMHLRWGIFVVALLGIAA